MHINTVLRKIQYQIARIEVIELLFWHGKNNRPSMETELAHNMIFTLRQNLFNRSEACFDSSLDSAVSFQVDLNSAINLLIKMNHGLDPSNQDVIFLKDLLIKIISDLSSLSSDLSSTISQLSCQFSISPAAQSESVIKPHDSFVAAECQQLQTDKVNQYFRNLVKKCMGDLEKAERLIQYEHRQYPDLSRLEAIRFAITRWERDNS